MTETKIEQPENPSLSSKNSDSWEDSIVSQILEKRKAGKKATLSMAETKDETPNLSNRSFGKETKDETKDETKVIQNTRKRRPTSEKQKAHLENMRIKAMERNKELKIQRDKDKEEAKKRHMEELIALEANKRIEKIIERIEPVEHVIQNVEKDNVLGRQLLSRRSGANKKNKKVAFAPHSEEIKNAGNNTSIVPPWV